PEFNPLTGVATVNGQPFPLPGNFTGAFGNMALFIDHGQVEHMTLSRWTDPNNPVVNVGSAVYRESVLLQPFLNQPLFLTTLPITDRAIYDWKNINLASPNYYNNEATTSTVLLEQVFLSTSRQKLAAQLGWYREHTWNHSRVAVGIPRSNPSSTT